MSNIINFAVLVLPLIVGVFILTIKNKKQLHYSFLILLFLLFVWILGSLFETYYPKDHTTPYFGWLWGIGLCFVPIVFLINSKIFAQMKIKYNNKYLFIIIIPCISYIVLLTNSYHHLFIEKFALYGDEIIYGKYFLIHSIYSYSCLTIGLFYFLFFSIKNSGFFSKQSILIVIGSLIPILANLIFTLKIFKLPINATALSFSLCMMFYVLAITKYKFLNVIPIALQRIVDLISDAYIVVNENLEIIDYNKTFIDTFKGLIKIKRKDNLVDALNLAGIDGLDGEGVNHYINKSLLQKKSLNFEKRVQKGDFNKFFEFEVTPIFSQDQHIGTIILLKDITEHKKNIDIIQQTQNQLVEKERLASLGELIGGIAHNLKTPIMSLSGGLEALNDLIKEYDESVEDKDVTPEDHHEIAKEMDEWVQKMKPYLSYMSDVITAVKDQAVSLNANTNRDFTIDEIVKRIEILMKHELKKAYCTLNIDILVEKDTIIKGEIINLVQVFNNLITNATHAYEGKGGNIDFKILRNNDNIEFVVQDYGKGISGEIKDKLFKQMVTTKGTHGTGLGLYMSYSTIKGKFGGDMWFESQEGKGTTFRITIPCGK